MFNDCPLPLLAASCMFNDCLLVLNDTSFALSGISYVSEAFSSNSRSHDDEAGRVQILACKPTSRRKGVAIEFHCCWNGAGCCWNGSTVTETTNALIMMMQAATFLCLSWLMMTAMTATASCYPAIFVFGDSLSDTGNSRITDIFGSKRVSQLPYGETFPGFPFDRFSDGRLIVDFLATFTGLPLLNPSQSNHADFSHGVNYAVAGATALDAVVLRRQGVFIRSDNRALNVQVTRHLRLKAAALGGGRNSSMASPLRLPNSRAFTEGLYVIGISGNDYLNALQRRKMYPPSVVSAHILPQIIAAIRNATEVLYANGARHFLLFNLPPVGCAPVLLATMRMPARDKYGCLQDVNSLSYDHNVQLLATVEGLRSTYPDAYFVLADYYGAFVHLLQNKAAYGITNTLDACCGGGVFFPYRFNLLLFCSNRSTVKLTTLCSDPNAFISWDGIHFTDRFNCYAFNLTIASGTFLNPSNAFTHCAQH